MGFRVSWGSGLLVLLGLGSRALLGSFEEWGLPWLLGLKETTGGEFRV